MDPSQEHLPTGWTAPRLVRLTTAAAAAACKDYCAEDEYYFTIAGFSGSEGPS